MIVFITLVVVGFIISFIFLNKVYALSAKSQIVGIVISIIFILLIIVCSFTWRNYQKNKGKGFFGGLQEELTTKSFIGQTKKTTKYNNGPQYKYKCYFFSNGTYYRDDIRIYGTWYYDTKKQALFTDSLEMKVKGYDGSIITFEDNNELKIINKNTINLDSLKREEKKQDELAENLERQAYQEAEKSVLAKKIFGKWRLKLESNGGYHDSKNMGIYTFSVDNSGTCIDNNIKIDFKYKLDLIKQKIIISKPTHILLLKIKEYDGETLIGYPYKEPDNKYVFTKAL